MNAKSKSGIVTMFVAALFAGLVSAQSVAPWTRPADLLVADTGADVIYRLADSDLDGDYNDFGEVSTFFANGAQGATIALASAMAVGSDGSVFLSDTSTDLVHRLIDLNADGDAMDAGEVAFPHLSMLCAQAPDFDGREGVGLKHVDCLHSGGAQPQRQKQNT